MRKYKTRFLFALALVCLFIFVFATTAFCVKGDSITISYVGSSGVDVDDSVTSVTVTAGDANSMVILPLGTAPQGYSYVWISDDGKSYAGGSDVVFYDEETLTAIYAYNIKTEEDFYEFCQSFDDSAYVEIDKNQLETEPHYKRYVNVNLLSDITLTKTISLKSHVGSALNIILNGHTLTVKKDLDGVISTENVSVNFYGAGTVFYEGTNSIVNLNSTNTAGAEENKLFIGASAYVNAPNAILAKDAKSTITSGFPTVNIYGTVTCKNVLKIDEKTNRDAHINVYSRAHLTLNSQIAVGEGNKFIVKISGGTIRAMEKNVSFFKNADITFNIGGGSFAFSTAGDLQTLQEKLADGNKVLYRFANGSSKFGTVFPETCKSDHTYTAIATYEANCTHSKEIIYKCNNSGCALVYTSEGAPTKHNMYTNEKTEPDYKEPTEIDDGYQISRCSLCGCAQYEFIQDDPTDNKFTIVIDKGNGETETKTVMVKDVFDIDENRKITGIKLTDNIVSLEIPAGIKSVEFTKGNSSIKTVIFRDGIDVEVISLTKLTALETIEIKGVRHVKFNANCAPTTIKSIETSAEGVKVTFGDSAFSGRAALTGLVMSKNSVYTFGSLCFKGTGLTSLELKEDTTYNFVGERAFAETKLEYLYVGKGISSFDKKQFDTISTLKKIVLMSVTKLADGEFSGMGEGCVVYHHAPSLEMGNKTFSGSNKVVLYTVADITTGFDPTKTKVEDKEVITFGVEFTIIKGAKHEYKLEHKSATCTEVGYDKYTVLDCLCGENEGTKATKFKSVYTNSDVAESKEELDFTGKTYALLPHNPSENAVIRYINGVNKDGSYAKECTMCKKVLSDDSKTCAPLIISMGFSISEDEGGTTGAMLVRYVFNTAVMDDYVATLESGSFEYGVVFAARASGSLEDSNTTPLKETGEANTGVVKINGTDATGTYASLEMKISNINKETQSRISFIMAAYIIEGEKITYVQEKEIVSNPSGVTYKELSEIFG